MTEETLVPLDESDLIAHCERQDQKIRELEAALAEKEADWQLKYDLLTHDYEQKWGLSMRLQEQIAALTDKPVTLTNYHNPEDITFTGKKKKGNVLVTTCGHDPLANAIPCATCALEQVAALISENKRLRKLCLELAGDDAKREIE